jgi:hypothetical protein
MKFKAKLFCTIDADHPDRSCIADWMPGKVLTFEDVYTFNDSMYSFDEAVSYMKKDLLMVAGGGYNAAHVHNVQYDIRKVW